MFEIEERLKNELNIPIMHDDQHGTAIISACGLLNALEINGKKIEDIRIVVNGAVRLPTHAQSYIWHWVLSWKYCNG